MRCFLSLLLSIAMFMGLVGRMEQCADGCMTTEKACCQEESAMAVIPEPSGDDHGSCPDNENCPIEGHHHHGPCLHGMQGFALNSTDYDLPAPFAIRLNRESGHLAVPESPVRDLEKPPLI